MLKKYKKLIYIVFFCFFNILVSTAVGFASEVAGPNYDIDIEVAYGYNNTAKAGRYLPIHIHYTNKKDNIFNGEVYILLNESDNELYEYEYPLYIGALSDTNGYYNIPLGNNTKSLYIKIIDEQKNLILEKRVKLNINSDTAEIVIGVLSDTKDKLRYLDAIEINYGLLKTRVINLSTEEFPYEVRQLDQLDMIFISNYRIRDLSTKQSRILMDWVKKGGTMVLGTGKRVDDTLGRFAPELLDDIYESPRLISVDMRNGNNIPEEGNILELECVDVSLHGGNIVIPGEQMPIISVANKEKGLIAVAAYDFVDVSDYAFANSSYIDTVLSGILGAQRIDKLVNQVYGADNTTYWDIQPIISNGKVNKIPPVNLYIIEVIAYILLVGPGLYIFLRQRGLLSYYRRGVFLLALLFAFFIYIMAGNTRFKDIVYNYASIMDVSEDDISETTFINLRTPYNEEYSVKFDSSYSVLPITRDDVRSDRTDIVSDKSKGNISIRNFDTNTEVKILNAGAFKPKIFQLERNLENDSDIGFSGNIRIYKDRISGKIINNYNYTVNNAVIILYGKLIMLGDMQPKEERDLSKEKMHNIPLTYYNLTAAKISGLSSYKEPKITDRQYTTALDKSNMLAFYIGDYQSGYMADARVLAFPSIPINPNIFIDDKFEYSGITLLTSALSVDNSEGAYIYRPILVKKPKLISGSYNVETNSSYTIEPTVLEYYLGTDLNIEELNFEMIEKDFIKDDDNEVLEEFTGTMAFYNHITGNYDDIQADKTVFSYEELKDYLSKNNALTVRYTHSNSLGLQWNSILPMLTIIGSEKE